MCPIYLLVYLLVGGFLMKKLLARVLLIGDLYTIRLE
jgi:hypothetical protein